MDSSGWIEFITEGPNASFFAPAIEASEVLVVPTISLLEVYRWVAREKDEASAVQVVGAMQRATVIALDGRLAVYAAVLAARHKLPVADSVIYATALDNSATLWTQDADFEKLPNVRFTPRRPS